MEQLIATKRSHVLVQIEAVIIYAVVIYAVMATL